MPSPGDEEQEHGDSSIQEPVHEEDRAEQQQEERGREVNEGEGDDDDDDDEPMLKYDRIGGDIARVIKSDLVSAFCVGTKFLVFSFVKATLLTGKGNRLP